MPRRLNQKEIQEILWLYHQGYSMRDVAKQTNLAVTTVQRYVNQPIMKQTKENKEIANYYFNEKQSTVEEMIKDFANRYKDLPPDNAIAQAISIEKMANAGLKDVQRRMNEYVLESVKRSQAEKDNELVLEGKVEEEKEENSD